MPSGSRGGGGGSHFGGGSSHSGGGSHFGGSRPSYSSGSSHYGSWSFGGGPRAPRGPRVPRGPLGFRWGRNYYSMSSAKGFLVIFLLVISIITGIAGAGLIASNYEDELYTICQDYVYYHQMAEYAQSNSNYQTTATITGIYKRFNDKWYYEYSFKMYPNNPSNSRKVDGYTYCLYTDEDVTNRTIAVGKEITIAISDNVNYITSDTDSVPMDIVNFSSTDDGEYQMYDKLARENKRSGIIAFIVAVILFGTTVTLWIVFLKKVDKEEYEKSKSGDSSSSSINIDTKPKSKYCSYCGSLLDPDATSCYSCGAKISKE